MNLDKSQKTSDNKFVVQIKFASAPERAFATVPNLKYDKKNWFSFELDDASNSLASALNVLNHRYFTDGCGNNVNYRMSLAVNGANPSNGIEFKFDGSNPSQTTVQVIQQMLVAGGDISDHGYWHDPTGFGKDVSALQNTIIAEDFIKRTFNYQTRSKVVPTNYEGHVQAAFDRGYLYSTSEGTNDGFDFVGKYVPEGPYASIPKFGCLRRGFTDNWLDALVDLKKKIDLLNTKTNWFYRLGSHTLNHLPSFISFFNHIQTQSKDQLWVATTREILEYREMKNLDMTQNLLENMLTIEVDLSKLSSKNRWKDLSFKVESDQIIKSVISNTTNSSFNNSTGLVNIFEQTY